MSLIPGINPVIFTVGFVVSIIIMIMGVIFINEDIIDYRKMNKFNRLFPLPKEARWKLYNNIPHLMVNVGADGAKPDWREMVSLSRYSDGKHVDEDQRWYKTFMERAESLRNHYVSTNGFTKVPDFPLPGGKWEVKHELGNVSANVNGHYVPAGTTGDYRDTIAAMVVAIPKIIQESQMDSNKAEQVNILGEALVQEQPFVRAKKSSIARH